MTMKYDKYVVEKIRRINVRYYLIKVHGKYYIIDYSNPRDIKNYFPGLFPNTLVEWKIYDVADLQIGVNFHEKKSKKLLNWITVAFIFYLFNVMFFPENLNLSNLTYDPRILQFWPQTIGYVAVGMGLIFLILFFQKVTLDLNNSNELILKQVTIKELDSKKFFFRLPLKLRWLISMIVLIPLFILVGIAASSYSQLIVFFIMPLSTLFFGKFLTFMPESSRFKYQIIKSEEK